jgi:uncharacterized BrkB/YihY/UPF0761 family membrane protein
MTDSTEAVQRDVAAARNQGRRQGLAIAALALGLVSFLNLLGAEKSILAIVLSAMSGSVSRQVRRRSLAAIGLAILHLVTIGVVLVLFQEELGQLVELLQKLA